MTNTIYQGYLALLHFAAQLAFRWLPPPEAGQLFIEEWQKPLAKDLVNFKARDWLDLLMSGIDDPEKPLRYLELLCLEKSLDYLALGESLEESFRELANLSGGVVFYCDPDYPPLLKCIDDPPLAMTYIGSRDLLGFYKVAVVGSRKASAFSMLESRKIGRLLAQRKIAVVSGGAFGCDIAAHRGVLASESLPVPAIGVFAGGLGRLYPRRNERDFRELLRRGALFISERPFSAVCRAFDFPIRNRLITGLVEQVIVMQAGVKSGAMGTARLALDQGREVYVLQHPDDDIRAAGSLILQGDGSKCFLAAEHFIDQVVPGPLFS